MSLKHPDQKMSKSDRDPKSRILVTDSPEQIHAKLRGAVTDSEAGISFDSIRRPGVSNLVEILKHVTESRESSEYIAKDNTNISMRAFKEKIADEIIAALGGIREKFLELTAPRNTLQLHEEIAEGSKKARRKAGSTMDKVQHALGLREPPLTHGDDGNRRAREQKASWRTAGDSLQIEANPFETQQQDKLKNRILNEPEDDDGGYDLDEEGSLGSTGKATRAGR